jgi:hypothetical protein
MGKWRVDQSVNMIEVCVSKRYDFGRPYTTDPVFNQNMFENYFIEDEILDLRHNDGFPIKRD